MANRQSTQPAPEAVVNQSSTEGSFRIPYEFVPLRNTELDILGGSYAGQAHFINTVEDIAMGTQTLCDLLEWDEMRKERVLESDHPADEARPIFNDHHRSALLRLVSLSLNTLSRECDRRRLCLLDTTEEVSRG